MSVERPPPALGWLGVLRLGLVQAALGASVVLATSTLNRVMVVELGLAAVVPGFLVGLYHAVQLARPLWGHRSDRGGRRTPWIVGGAAVLALGVVGAAAATALMAESFAAGFALAFVAFAMIGAGLGAAGTALLALLASLARPERRAAAAAAAWLMMIVAIVITTVTSGHLLEPFSFRRLVAIAAGVCGIAFALVLAATWRLEAGKAVRPEGRKTLSFRQALAGAWADPQARLFTIFVFVSMIAYSMQDLILEPYAGLVFALSPGGTTRLSGLQYGGVLLGLVLAGAAGTLRARRHPRVLGRLMVGGGLLSAAALAALGLSAAAPSVWPLPLNVGALGVGNGVFTLGAIASMMALAGEAGSEQAGLRLGLWSAAQGIAFALGGFSGTAFVGALHLAGLGTEAAYGTVFLAEAALFAAAAVIAARFTARWKPLGEGLAPLPT